MDFMKHRIFEAESGPQAVMRPRSGTFGMRLLMLMIAGAIILSSTPLCEAKGPSEYQVKAAFVYNFARFIDWPPQSFADDGSPFVLGVIGDSEIASAVEQIVKGKTVSGRRMVYKRLSADAALDGCNLLLIGATEKRNVGRILDRLKDNNIVTVGETEGFVRYGGVIGFVVQSSKVGFDINVAAAGKKHLKVSSQLLKLARNVID